MNKLSFFIVNIFINSFLVFFTAALLVEGIIFYLEYDKGELQLF